MWRIASAVDSYRPDSEDRAVVVRVDDMAVLAVADGMGGRSGGGCAAEAVVVAVESLAGDARRFTDDRLGWTMALDRSMAETDGVGESTGVIVLTALGPLGVAVGDSVAWDIRADSVRNLAAGSEPKPWLGSGVAIPRLFAVPRNHLGTLLLATDGLVKYAASSAIQSVIRAAPFDDIPKRLIELARMSNGVLQDDVSVIVARWEENE